MSVVVSTNKQDLLMSALSEFYNKSENINKLKEIVEKKSISLRIIDWFVTNYSKKQVITIDNVNLYTDYKLQLKGYSKKQFDPFCRRERIKFFYQNDDNYIETTVGQLNFFKWAISKKIITYIEQNINIIETDMNNTYRENYGSKNKQERKKRSEISVNATKTLSKQSVKILLEFN